MRLALKNQAGHCCCWPAAALLFRAAGYGAARSAAGGTESEMGIYDPEATRSWALKCMVEDHPELYTYEGSPPVGFVPSLEAMLGSDLQQGHVVSDSEASFDSGEDESSHTRLNRTSRARAASDRSSDQEELNPPLPYPAWLEESIGRQGSRSPSALSGGFSDVSETMSG
mmetsp:Transcript_41666/g.94029  ORF Transcript_41666/g.94029 Transcript_41666/m.94029 type:complete len:170 (-) Transcript_41666:55-564(-)